MFYMLVECDFNHTEVTMNFVLFLLGNFILLMLIPDLPLYIQLIWLWILFGLGIWKGNQYIKEIE